MVSRSQNLISLHSKHMRYNMRCMDHPKYIDIPEFRIQLSIYLSELYRKHKSKLVGKQE